MPTWRYKKNNKKRGYNGTIRSIFTFYIEKKYLFKMKKNLN